MNAGCHITSWVAVINSMVCNAWSRNDAASVGGSRAKYGELSATSRSTLQPVRRHAATTDGDDQPLSLTDRLKSTPADPVDMMQRQQQQQQPTDQTRCVCLPLNMI